MTSWFDTVAMPFCPTRHVVDHDEDEWSADTKAYKLDFERFFGIVIYFVPTLFLHTESTNSMITRKCTTFWGEPDRVHMQNMERLHAYDCHQNVAEPQATWVAEIYTRVHRNC